MKKPDYRKRFFDQYVTTHWQYTEKISLKSYKIVAKILQKHISAFLPKDKSASILDVGCGSGHFLYFLQNQGYYKAQGIDLGSEQLEIARKTGVKNIQQVDMVQYLEKCHDRFDMIIVSQIIEHFTKEETLQLLDLIYKKLKPKGKILAFTPNVLTYSGLYTTFGDFTHELVFTPRSLSQLLRVCGFSTVQIFGLAPIAYDLRSGIRTILWKILRAIYKICFLIERGTGRSIWESKPIFETIILAVGEKRREDTY